MLRMQGVGLAAGLYRGVYLRADALFLPRRAGPAAKHGCLTGGIMMFIYVSRRGKEPQRFCHRTECYTLAEAPAVE